MMENVLYRFTAVQVRAAGNRLIKSDAPDIWRELSRLSAETSCHHEFLRVEEIIVDGTSVWKREPTQTIVYHATDGENEIRWISTSGDSAGDRCLVVKGSHQTDIGELEPTYRTLRIGPLRERNLGERTRQQLDVMKSTTQN